MAKQYEFIEDLDSVLERLGSNLELLEKLLGKFLHSYQNTKNTFFTLIQENKQEEAERLIHSLKGVSGNLGFSSVYQEAVKFDSFLKKGDYTEIELYAEPFFTELDHILIELQKNKDSLL